jgi:hypothetical protein
VLELAVVRRLCLVLLLLSTCGAAAAAPESLTLATTSPDGATRFYWSNPYRSGSIAADGLPLVVGRGARRVLVPFMLQWRDYLTWCGRSLVAVAGGDRFTTHAKRLVVSAPPYRRTRPLSRDVSRSWASPACAPDGSFVVASAGPSSAHWVAGRERRSLWWLPLDGSRPERLTTAPAGRSDEAPCISADSATVYFVRSGPVSRATSLASGRLFAFRLADRRVTPLERLAPGEDVFGHYAWPVTPRCGG